MNKALRKAALEALTQCGSFTLLETDLHNAICLQMRPDRPTLAETQHELLLMERDLLVVGGRNPLKEIRWKLTAEGSAAATELGLL